MAKCEICLEFVEDTGSNNFVTCNSCEELSYNPKIRTREEIFQDILQTLPKNPHGEIKVSVRVGKTRIALGLLDRDNPESILWVSSSNDLLKKDLPAEAEKWGYSHLVERIKTTHYRSLAKYTGHFDTIIMDEYQHLTEDGSLNLKLGILTCKNVIFLSGAPPKGYDKLQILRALKSKTLYEYTIEEATKDNVISDYTINVLEFYPNNSVKAFPVKKTGQMLTEWEVHQKNNASMIWAKHAAWAINKRASSVRNSPTKLEVLKTLVNSLKGRKLVFCNSIQVAEDLGGDFAWHSQKKTKEPLDKFLSGESESLFLVNAGGTGYTFRGIDNLILAQATRDKNGDTSQKIARTLLHQGSDYKGNIWILKLMGTVDEEWVNKTLERFPKENVKIVNAINLLYNDSNNKQNNIKSSGGEPGA